MKTIAKWAPNGVQFAQLFPFHIALDRNLHIVQLGHSIGKCCHKIAIGDPLSEHFQVLNPDEAVDFSSLIENKHMLFVLRDRQTDIKLRGQISQSEDPDVLFFLGSPWVAGSVSLKEIGLTMLDFAIHDSTVDLLQVLQATKAALAENRLVTKRLTEQKKALTVARDLAEAANKSKSQFLANMSHELRTPLNAILGFSQMLEIPMLGELTERQAQYNKNIYSSATHLLNIINDILDLAKIEAGRLELQYSKFYMPPVFEEARTLMNALAIKGKVELQFELQDDLPMVNLDAAKLKQILINLISNSVKFTEPGGVIRITCQTVSIGNADLLKIQVVDQGSGIDPAKLELVFDEFAQANESMTRASEGTGLGLALVRRLLGVQGGCIWAQSPVEDGRGTAMTILLPMDAEIPKSTVREFDNTKPVALMFDNENNYLAGLDVVRENSDIAFLNAADRLEGFGRILVTPPELCMVAVDPQKIEDDLLLLRQLRAIPGCDIMPIAIFTEGSLDADARHLYKQLVNHIFDENKTARFEKLVAAIEAKLAPA